MYEIPESPSIDLALLAEMEHLHAEATSHAHTIYAGGKLDDGNIEIRHLSRFDTDTLSHVRTLEITVITEFRRRHVFGSLAEAHAFVKENHAKTMALSTDFAEAQDALSAMAKEIAVLDTLQCLYCDETVKTDLTDDYDYLLVCPNGHVETIPAVIPVSNHLAERTKRTRS